MKRLKSLLGAFLMMLLLTTVVLTTTGCEGSTTQKQTVVDSVSTYNVDLTLNPSFASVQEVIIFQNNLINQYQVDEVFVSLPQEILKNVSTVCLKKSNKVTKEQLVSEYLTNKHIYDSLAPDLITHQETTAKEDDSGTAVEEQPTIAPRSVSYHYEIDTIDGKASKVLVKEERYESK